jgi:hypothetical protein
MIESVTVGAGALRRSHGLASPQRDALLAQPAAKQATKLRLQIDRTIALVGMLISRPDRPEAPFHLDRANYNKHVLGPPETTPRPSSCCPVLAGWGMIVGAQLDWAQAFGELAG